MIEGEDIKRLIPQRYPMMMVSAFEADGDDTATTALTITGDNYFLLPGDELSETGLIEHIAQSASALAGWLALQQHQDEPPIGLIGEVKHFNCQRRARLGETIQTTIHFGLSFGPVTIISGESRVDGELIAEAKMKIFIQ